MSGWAVDQPAPLPVVISQRFKVHPLCGSFHGVYALQGESDLHLCCAIFVFPDWPFLARHRAQRFG
jgi:hypothetical protein